jgi:hypothetical protein
MPMLTGTLITAAGFLPIGLAKSVTGEYTFAIFAVTVIALLDAFPMLQVLHIGDPFLFSEPFLNKLKQAKHLKRLELKSKKGGVRPTRAWLAESCPRFPKTLEYLYILFSKFEPDEDDLQGGSKEEYIEFIKASFRSCLPKLTWLVINNQ